MSTLTHLSLFFLFFFILSPLSLSCHPADMAALLKIKSSFLNPAKLTSWNNSTNCCTWFGIQCSPQQQNRVTSLSYYNTHGPAGSLSGNLPNSLGDLPFLSTLTIGNHPNLSGELPFTLTRLPFLSFLNLARNSLSGTLPCFLPQIPSLNTLNLSFNKFRGLIPPKFSAFPSLQYLYLDANNLEGPIPASIAELTKSPLPLHLSLSKNLLSGDVPAELGVPDWRTLVLSHNKLAGDVKAIFGAGKALTYLDLAFNRLEFDMTGIEFPVKLKILSLESNMITGSIPAQINQLGDLISFNVSYNQLCGIVPAGPVMDKFDDSNFFGNRCLCRSEDTCI